jgi:glycogen debranching enzyme
LGQAALGVLHKNDLGGWTKPAPRLYPHQWSWDSAFVAIGLAHSDLDRALRELETLFEAQWSDGRVPHIVFNPLAQDYFPGPDRWASARTSPMAPRTPATSGLIQPPVHALALQRILDKAHHQNAGEPVLARIDALFAKVLAWHRYLARSRDPAESGLLVIYHPWESGTDNSPRWDATLARLQVGDVPAYERNDLKHVEDPSERPTHAEYDRYLWLVELLKVAGYNDAAIQHDYPFQIRDVLMSAIFAAACAGLAQTAESLGRDRSELDELASRFSAGVQNAWDPELRLALDWDSVAGEAVRVETCAGLAPLFLPGLAAELLPVVVERLRGPGFAGAEGLAYRVIPSTAPGSKGFAARAYWRGPSWPVANWLFWLGLAQHGQREAAANLRSANLALLNRPSATFAEYFEPYTAEPLGSLEQSWTAAVVLDWLAVPD